MAFKMRVVEDSLDLQTIISASDDAGQKIMKNCASIIKARSVSKLKAAQKVHYNKNGYEIKRTREIHMADDVVIKSGKDKFGHMYCKVGGGKQTGTLWHLLNDGTYKNAPTHFMDNVVSETNSECEIVVDNELRKVFP